MTDVQQVRLGYQQFVPPQAPPGMDFDPRSGLLLPRGVRLASRGQVAAASTRTEFWETSIINVIVDRRGPDHGHSDPRSGAL